MQMTKDKYARLYHFVVQVAWAENPDLSYHGKTWFKEVKEHLDFAPPAHWMKQVITEIFENAEERGDRKVQENCIYMMRQFSPRTSVDFEKRTFKISPKEMMESYTGKKTDMVKK